MRFAIVVAFVAACTTPATPATPTPPTTTAAAPTRPPPALPIDRIAVVGASVSAGFGGTPFADAFTAAGAPAVDAIASAMFFQDPIANARLQIDRALAFRATTIVALDFLFWEIYGSPDPTWRERALTSALAELARARDAGAFIVLGNVPRVVTAAEWMLPAQNIPSEEALATVNARVAAWAAADATRTLLVPFAAWTAPLALEQDVTLPDTDERVPARSLVALDGLHANPFGTWYLLALLDRFIEQRLPGTRPDALVFRRPISETPEP